MPNAQMIKDNVPGCVAPGRLYRLDAPLNGNDHVLIVHQPELPNLGMVAETLVLPAEPDGTIRNPNAKLPGSFVGIHDDAGALWAAGGFEHGEPYSIVVPEVSA